MVVFDKNNSKWIIMKIDCKMNDVASCREDIKTPYHTCLHPEWDFEPDKAGITAKEQSRITKEKREMAHTKQVQRKNTQSMTRVTHASTTVQSLPLPNGIKEEGELLYQQYFMLYGNVTRTKRTFKTSFKLDRQTDNCSYEIYDKTMETLKG